MVMISTLSYDATLHRRAMAWAEAIVTMSSLSGYSIANSTQSIAKHSVPEQSTTWRLQCQKLAMTDRRPVTYERKGGLDAIFHYIE